MSINFLILICLSLLTLNITLSYYPNYIVLGQNSEMTTEPIPYLSKEIEGIKCDRSEHTQFHNHTLLVININNESQTVPGGIGIIPNECLFWLHTHDDSGIIHIESPYNSTFTLDQFLQIWDKFDDSPIVKTLSSGSMISNTTILLENHNTLTTDRYKDIKLNNHNIITINMKNNSEA